MTDAMHVVLLVEDDEALRNVLRVLFEANGFRVVVAGTAAQGEHDARLHRPDVIIVDLGLPDRDGLNVITAVRVWSPVPIIVLSARVEEAQRVLAFDKGADDYVIKPFSAPELLARVRALLRRYVRGDLPMAVLRLGDVTVDLGRRTVTSADGREVRLTPLEHRILETLARHGGGIVTHSVLLKEVWGPSHSESGHYLRIYMGHLRQKLEDDPAQPKYLQTETAVGYRLVLTSK